MCANVRVVGAGIAGLACARVVAAAGHRVQVHERARHAGGRMASRTLAGRPVDLGASYFTCRDEEFRAVVEHWVERGLAHPWTTRFAVQNELGRSESEDGPLRYGARLGLGSLSADLAIGLDLVLNSEVTEVGPGPTVAGDRVDAVVLAMPDPQALALLSPRCTAERAALSSAEWAPTLAVAAGWPERTWDVDGVFVHGDPVLDWIADDGRRRADQTPVLVAHTTREFAEANADDLEQAATQPVDAIRQVLGLATPPTWTYVHYWPCAKPLAPRLTPFYLGSDNIGLCGDAWGSPRVETAWLSGHRLGQALAHDLG